MSKHKWTEEELNWLTKGLEDGAEDLTGVRVDGFITVLEYYEPSDRYSVLYQWLDYKHTGQKAGHITMNFGIDWGSGAPVPHDIEQYGIHGHGVKFLCGFTEREEFIEG